MGVLDGGFPFRRSISLEKLIDFWVDAVERPGSPWAAQAREVLRHLEEAPELRGPRIDTGAARARPELVRMLLSAHFPAMEGESPLGMYGSAGVPFSFDTIFETPGTDRLAVLTEEALYTGTQFEPEMMIQGTTMAAYEHVLRFCYGIDVDFDPPLVITVEDPDTELLRHFQILWDSQFMTVTPREGTRRATPEELAELLAEPMDFERWSRILPPDAFELGGLGISWAAEVTTPEANSLLKEGLLREDALASPARIDELQTHVRTLMGRKDVRIGLIAFHRDGGIEEMDRAIPLGRSLLMRDGGAPPCPMRADSSYAEALATPAPLVIQDLATCPYSTGFEQSLVERGLRSLALLPLHVEGRRVGLLEVGSPTPGSMTMYQAIKLGSVTCAFGTAMQRSMAAREDRLMSVIKERYTSLHPSVEWRFRDAAAHIVETPEADEGSDQEEIVFHDVYPLYGLTDIRGSSNTRARAIQADLGSQIQGALAVVREAGRVRRLPALDQLDYRLSALTDRVDGGVVSEDESQVLAFLVTEVEPLMDELAALGREVAARVRDYREALDPELGIVYRERRAFEAGVARFNEVVGSVIDREQEVVQSVFPHYFERFKTDGVDYNAYIGESICEKGGFSPLYLHNLRLWQLQLASRIQWALDQAAPDFESDLAATHLILVQDQPLSIRFRVDEKRFDVDGAYNIRYELVKKRIDKARIRGTGERLTRPGTLAIVYGHRREALEYQRYLEFLIDGGYFEGAIEHYELEDMQGVLGLKAFRVAIAGSGAAKAEEAGRGRARQASGGGRGAGEEGEGGRASVHADQGGRGAVHGDGPARPTLAEVEGLGAAGG